MISPYPWTSSANNCNFRNRHTLKDQPLGFTLIGSTNDTWYKMRELSCHDPWLSLKLTLTVIWVQLRGQISLVCETRADTNTRLQVLLYPLLSLAFIYTINIEIVGCGESRSSWRCIREALNALIANPWSMAESFKHRLARHQACKLQGPGPRSVGPEIKMKMIRRCYYFVALICPLTFHEFSHSY